MFIFSVESYIAALEEYAPEILVACRNSESRLVAAVGLDDFVRLGDNSGREGTNT